jgi:hypothetical protein
MNDEYLVISLISLIIAIILQPVRKYADRQAHRSYIEQVGVEHATETPEHVWLEDRHLAGRWGFLYVILQALQGIAIILTIGGIVYWWLL